MRWLNEKRRKIMPYTMTGHYVRTAERDNMWRGDREKPSGKKVVSGRKIKKPKKKKAKPKPMKER